MHNKDIPATMMALIREKFGERMEEFAFPPPVLETMQGEFLELDLQDGSLTTQFPVLESYLNPYYAMQGGMIAAAVDNTLGPLSVLIAPPNMTRRLELTYSLPVTLEMEVIVVHARLVERNGQWLYFQADVRSRDGSRVARAKAVHWILDEEPEK